MLLKTTRLMIAILLLYTGNVALAEIYKWVDENGQMHYSDIPENESTRIFDADKKPANPPASEEGNRSEYQKRVLDSMSQERRQREQKKAEQNKKQSERKRQCEQAQKRLNEAENARYLYTKDEQGETVIFSDEQRQAAIGQARAAVKQYCN